MKHTTAEALELFAAEEKLRDKLREATNLAEGLREQAHRMRVELPVRLEASNLTDVADLVDELVELLRFAAEIRKGAAAP